MQKTWKTWKSERKTRDCIIQDFLPQNLKCLFCQITYKYWEMFFWAGPWCPRRCLSRRFRRLRGRNAHTTECCRNNHIYEARKFTIYGTSRCGQWERVLVETRQGGERLYLQRQTSIMIFLHPSQSCVWEIGKEYVSKGRKGNMFASRIWLLLSPTFDSVIEFCPLTNFGGYGVADFKKTTCQK